MQTVYDAIKLYLKQGKTFDEAAKEVERRQMSPIPEHIKAIARQEIDMATARGKL